MPGRILGDGNKINMIAAYCVQPIEDFAEVHVFFFQESVQFLLKYLFIWLCRGTQDLTASYWISHCSAQTL